MTIVWKDLVVEKPKTYKINDNGDGTFTLIPAFGTTLEQGTPVNASNMNKLLDKTGDTVTGTLLLNNNVQIRGKKTDGSDVLISYVDTANNTILGSTANLTKIHSNANPMTRIGSTDYTFYHTGFKPTAAQIGAVEKIGDTMTGKLSIQQGSSIGLELNRRAATGNNISIKLSNDFGGTIKDRYLGVADGKLKFGEASDLLANGLDVITSAGGTFTGNVTVNATLVVGKVANTSTISFPASSNDPGWIKHAETNNVSIMEFCVSDDASNEDQFRFIVNPSAGRKDLLILKGSGALTLEGSMGVRGNITLTGSTSNFIAPNNYGYCGKDSGGTARYMLWMGNDNTIQLSHENRAVRCNGKFSGSGGNTLNCTYIMDTSLPNTSGGLRFSGGANNRTLFLGGDTDWGGGQPRGQLWGDIWIQC